MLRRWAPATVTTGALFRPQHHDTNLQVRYASAKFLEQSPKQRNIGISAHIDSGKTTLTERILFYTGKIKAIHEVKGKTDAGATMDSMELEKERGITIRSAATFCRWKDAPINLIDTPGHVDFTIEVERALRVLDGAVLLICGVSGVQTQTQTVDRQMKRYGVPRLCFINKLDRDNSCPRKAIKGAQGKMNLNAALIQIPIGATHDFAGVVDIIEEKAYYFEGEKGETIRQTAVPEYLLEETATARTDLLSRLGEVDEGIEEMFLEEKTPSVEQIHDAIRRATIANKFIPTLMGTAFKNKGVQLLLDAVTRYLPSPGERTNMAYSCTIGKDEDGARLVTKGDKEVGMVNDDEKPLIAMVFKLEETPGLGLSNYVRVYQGKLSKGDQLINMRTGKTFSPGRLVRMHAATAENITSINCGEICSIVGEIDASSGDTIMRKAANAGEPLICSDMYVPPQVMARAIKPIDVALGGAIDKRLAHYVREDPTFKFSTNEAGERVIEGMGELHLDVYIERLKREHGLELDVGKPTVNYREVITESVKFDHQHKKQSGGQGQFAVLRGTMQPLAGIDMSSERGNKNKIELKAPNADIKESLQKSFKKVFDMKLLRKGPMIGAPLWGVHIHLSGGAMHEVDSTDMAFKAAAETFWQTWFVRCKPTLVEPFMTVEIRCPYVNQNDVVSAFGARGGITNETNSEGDESIIRGEAAAEDMFGFISQLRQLTKGYGDFTMEFKEYRAMDGHKAQGVINARCEALERPTFDLKD